MKTNIDNLDNHLKTLWANINDDHLGGVFDILSDAMVELNMIRMKANGDKQGDSNCNIPHVSESLPIRYCQQCGEPLRRNKHKTWCEHYSGNVR